MTKPLRERMGRVRDPELPHPFEIQTTDTVEHGGATAPSAICGLCDRRKDDGRHGGAYASQGALRDTHGPFGQ